MSVSAHQDPESGVTENKNNNNNNNVDKKKERSFIDALKSRYGTDDIEQYSAEDFLLVDPKLKKKNNKKWELVGMEKTKEKQSQYHLLTHVVLKEEGITCAVKPDEEKIIENENNNNNKSYKDALEALQMNRLELLDLSGNTSLTLEEVQKLIQYFPRLNTLQTSDIPSLLLLPTASTTTDSSCDKNNNNTHNNNNNNNNNMVSPAREAVSIHHTLQSHLLTKLVFNNVGFKSICQLKNLIEIKNLKELHLDNNEIETLLIFENETQEREFLEEGRKLEELVFHSIETLSLAHNKIKHWRKGEENENNNHNHNKEKEEKKMAEEEVKDTSCERRLSPSQYYSFSQTVQIIFPQLRELYLTDNCLSSVSKEELEAALAEKQNNNSNNKNNKDYYYLEQLTLLCLKDSPSLNNVRVLDYLRVYGCQEVTPPTPTTTGAPSTALTRFRITYDYLLPDWNPTLSRMYTIASLPTITLLNRGEVRRKERYDSELFYIQRGLARRAALEAEREKEKNTPHDVEETTTAAAAPSCNAEEERRNSELDYPDYRYLDTLYEKHKDVIQSLGADNGGGDSILGKEGTSHVMLNLTIETTNLYQNPKKTETTNRKKPPPQYLFERVQKQLPSSLTVGQLKQLCRSLFQIDLSHQSIHAVSGSGADGVLPTSVPLDREDRSLAYYGVSSGDTLQVTDLSVNP